MTFIGGGEEIHNTFSFGFTTDTVSDDMPTLLLSSTQCH